MLPILLAIAIWITSISGWGYFGAALLGLKPLASNHEEPAQFALLGFIGFFVLVFCGLIFFLALGDEVGFPRPFMLVGLVGIVPAIRTLRLRSLAIFSATVAMIVFVAYAASGAVYHYDTGLYHLQAVEWTRRGTVLPRGLANLHGRFGFNSSWWIAAALFDPRSARGHALQILNPVLVFFAAIAVCGGIRRLWRGPETRMSDLWLAALAFPLTIRAAGSIDLNSLSTDLPAGVISLFAVYALLRASREPLFGPLAALLAVFAMTIKLSAAPMTAATIVTAIAIRYRARASFYAAAERPAWIRAAVFSAILLVFWMARGVWISGAALYPLPVLHFESLDWAVPAEQMAQEAQAIRAWARAPGWPPDRALESWDWLAPWLRGFVDEETLVLAGFALAGALMLFISGSWRTETVEESEWLPFAPIAFAGIAWFLLAPDLRFGWGYVHGASLFILCRGILACRARWSGISVFRAGLVGFCAFVLLGLSLRVAGLHRESGGWAWNVKQPPLYEWPELPSVSVRTGWTYERSPLFYQSFPIGMDPEGKVWSPTEGDQCWLSQFPCVPVPMHPPKVWADPWFIYKITPKEQTGDAAK